MTASTITAIFFLPAYRVGVQSFLPSRDDNDENDQILVWSLIVFSFYISSHNFSFFLFFYFHGRAWLHASCETQKPVNSTDP